MLYVCPTEPSTTTLYKASNIKLLIPQVLEAGGIIPTASTTVQLALGDALAIAAMQNKKFGKLDFKKIHLEKIY